MIISRHSFLISLIVAVILAAPLAAQDCLDAPETRLDEADYVRSVEHPLGTLRIYNTPSVNATEIISMSCRNYLMSADEALSALNHAKRIPQSSDYDDSPSLPRCSGEALLQDGRTVFYEICKNRLISIDTVAYYCMTCKEEK